MNLFRNEISAEHEKKMKRAPQHIEGIARCEKLRVSRRRQLLLCKRRDDRTELRETYNRDRVLPTDAAGFRKGRTTSGEPPEISASVVAVSLSARHQTVLCTSLCRSCLIPKITLIMSSLSTTPSKRTGMERVLVSCAGLFLRLLPQASK